MTQEHSSGLLLTESGIQHRVPRRTLSHHPVFGPGMATAEVELLVLGSGWQVEGLGVVRGVDAVQKGDDVRVGIAQADDLECISIDVADAQTILADQHPPEMPQL